MLTSTQKCPLRYGCHSVTYTSSFRKASETCWECFTYKCRKDIRNFVHLIQDKEMQHLRTLCKASKGKSAFVNAPIISYILVYRVS